MPIAPAGTTAARRRRACIGRAAVVLAALIGAGAAADDAPAAYFTDEVALVATALPDGPRSCQVRVIDRGGISRPRSATAQVAHGRLALRPLREGIHVVDAGDGVELRFLAMDPPPPADPTAVERALPRSGRRLLAGEPFRMLALGDSVTATGRYDRLLARLLERATGNRRIATGDRSYPGRSVDAAVRCFAGDTANGLDLGLLMYGLNDQAAGVSPAAYREQCAWIARHLADDRAADCVLLQPTPHLDLAAADLEGDALLVRTIGFAALLRSLGADLGVPVAETFAAMWGAGGDGIRAGALALAPLYPRSFDRQLTAMVEGDGDGIHPNALGNLAIARAALAAIAGLAPAAPPLVVTAAMRWTADGVVGELTARNAGDVRRSGRLELHAPPWARVEPDGDAPYDLPPGGTTTVALRWPGARAPEDLLRWPNDLYLAAEEPWLVVADVAAGGCRVAAVAAPFALPADLDRARRISEDGAVDLPVRWPGGGREVRVAAPEGADVARVPVVERVEADGAVGWAVGEVAFTRFAGALAGEIACDGRLDEWADAVWSPLGEPCQARSWRGPVDHRGDGDRCRLRWSARVGATALHLAIRGEGDLARDGFTVFLDPRAPAELGTAGPYWWVGGAIAADGAVALSKGETTAGDPPLSGRWTRDGDEWRVELSLPYGLWGATAFPAAGDLGLSLNWDHRGPDGATTLAWCEDGHPWNTRWYGVLRLQPRPDRDALPFVVRVH